MNSPWLRRQARRPWRGMRCSSKVHINIAGDFVRESARICGKRNFDGPIICIVQP